MQLLAYILAYPILWLFSILPFRVLYFLSDIVYVLVYYIIGYRKKAVRFNMSIALPHLTQKEQRIIEKKFYHHFCDGFVEMVKTMTISEKEMKKRFILENMEVVNEYEKKGKSIALLIAHYGSYEWLLYMNTRLTTHKGYGIYKRIRNPYFDGLVKRIRGKFNAELIDTKESVGVMKTNKKNGVLGCYGFITDQSPKIYRVPYWGNFFGKIVPIHVGGEMLSKKMDMNVIYVISDKIKRGYYKATFVPFTGEVKETPDFEITDIFLRMLEQKIIEKPEYYLWTHKRFKHIRTPEEQEALTKKTTP